MNSFEKEGFRRKLAHLLLNHGLDEVNHEDETLLKAVSNLLKELDEVGLPRPCCSCGKMLECIVGDWSSYQPYGGCEITITGSYGSRRYDPATLRGIICDDCVGKLSLERERNNF